MTYTMEDFDRDVKKEVLRNLTDEDIDDILEQLAPEDRMKGLRPEDLMKGLRPEDRMKGLELEERLGGYSLEEIEKFLKKVKTKGSS